jgi:hypothetical protein
VHADLALAYKAALCLMDELDGIFDRQDVSLQALVHRVDHGGERRRLAGARLAGDEDHSLCVPAEVMDDLGHAQVSKG